MTNSVVWFVSISRVEPPVCMAAHFNHLRPQLRVSDPISVQSNAIIQDQERLRVSGALLFALSKHTWRHLRLWVFLENWRGFFCLVFL